MAVRQGYGSIPTDGLVLAYDTGDMLNSFKGKPTTNLLTRIGYDYGEQNSDLFKSHYGYEEVYIPALGKKNAHFCEIYNDYNGGSGNCCLSLFSFGNFSVSPSTTYTYQIIYKTTTGYANGNYMYHYEYGPGGYVTEYGLWSSGREEDLGDGWKHAWGTFTTNANTSTFYTYLFHYEYATFNKVQVAGVMLTQGSEIFRPQQFIPVASGIPESESILNIAGPITMKPINDCFDDSGDLNFDGTNTRIEVQGDVLDANSPYSLFTVLKPTNISSPDYSFPWYNSYPEGFWHHVTATSVAWRFQDNYGNLGGVNIQNGVYTTLAIVWDGIRLALYQNGTLRDITPEGTTIGSYNNTAIPRIGMLASRSEANDYNYNGKAPVNLVYNRALTEEEIASMHQHYKTRYSI